MQPQPHEQRTCPSGVNRVTENAIIGIELTYIGPNGISEEIMMLVPPGGRFVLPNSRYANYGARMQVTLHTSDGDRTGQIQM